MHARHGPDRAGDPPARADDDLAVDGLAQDAVGRADVVLALRRDGRGLEAEARLAHGRGRLRDALVLRLAPAREREVVVHELVLGAAHAGIEHPDRLLEQLLSGLVAVEDDDPRADQAFAARAVELEVVGVLLQRGDHEREVLVEVDAQLLGARAQLVAVDRGRERRRLHLLLDGLRRQAVDAGRAHIRAGHEEARQLVDGEQRLLHRRVARDAEEIGMRRDGAHQLGRVAARLELLQRDPRVAGLQVRVALVVEVVQQPCDAPQLLVGAEAARVGPHRGLDGEDVLAQGR